jgi:ParB-like chromosome segregation protein Spo0J
MSVDMEFHPLANAFPLMEGAEFDELVDSIRERGQLEKILVYEEMILDGRNRYRACKAAGVTPYSETFEGTPAEARDHVVDANLRRRHLDASQRALIAARLATLGHGGDRRSERAANLPVPTQAEAADRLNVSERSVRDAVKVRDHGAPELVAAVERGDVPVSRAAKIASLPKERQAAKISEPNVASPPNLPPTPSGRPLRNLENISGGELARWVKITTPSDRQHVIRVLETAAGILRDELEIRREAATQ